MGYAAGAVLAGVTADLFGMNAAMILIAAITFASGVVVAARLKEGRRRDRALSAS